MTKPNKTADRRWQCPHGNRIRPGSSGGCGCRAIGAAIVRDVALARHAPSANSRDGASKLHDDYFAQAHELCISFLHCGTLFGGKDHSQIEQAVAKALVSAFHRGKNARGRR